ncbi:PREDICTED: glutathione S-transferase T3-like [Fragaria vesca subsp. vesca]|uniref:glutathione S-transferase T3-like n=1 Tax=Fragaria vesca subsp. vesca TaxID=101020 RepID=UPI0002C2ECA8|nr:PREDICTED: glutathione S-transferase T3-like [Fragaria vesca subsp. vesca]
MGSKNHAYFTNLLTTPVLDDSLIENDGLNNNNGYMSSQVPAMTSDIPPQNQPSKKKRERASNYSVQEDNQLVAAWLNVGLDPIKGNDKKSTTYWERIATYYHKHKDFVSDRDSASLQHRWQNIQYAVNKFCGCWEQIENRPKSGESYEDKLLRAKDKYKNDEHGAFQHEHNWNSLRYTQKWISFSHKKAANAEGKKRKSLNPEVCASPIVLDEGNAATPEPSIMDRPIGQKQAKELLKKEKVKDNITSQLELLREMKSEAERKKEERFQLSVYQEQKLLSLKEKKEQAKQQREDDKIMFTNMDTLSPMQAAYIRDRQAEIMAKRGLPSSN